MTNSERLSKVRARLLQWLHENVVQENSAEQENSAAPNVIAIDSQRMPESEQCIAENEERPSGSDQPVAMDEMDENVSKNEADESDAPQGPPEEPVRVVSEAILIRDGFYAGRTFSAIALDEPFKATWFMEPDELKIRSKTGDVVAVFRGEEISATKAPLPESPSTIPLPAAKRPIENDAENGDDALPQAA